MRSIMLLALLACALQLSSGTSHAQAFPFKVIRIATAEAGGGADYASRVLAQALPGSAGWQVIVENRPGAGIAAEYVAKAAPDGYTLLINGSTIWLGPLMLESPRYDPIRDFAPITMTHRAHNILVIHPAVPARNVKELITLARERPVELDYASANLGSTSHLSAELFKAMAGVNFRRIPFKGTGQALNALVAGQVQIMFASAVSVAPLVKSGKLRGLAVTGDQVLDMLPDVPLASATVPGYEAVQMYGVFAPAKTPVAVISRLNQEMVRVITSPDVREKYQKAGGEAVGSSPEYLGQAVKADIQRMGKVIKEAGIREE